MTNKLNKPKRKEKITNNAILEHQNKYVYFNICMGKQNYVIQKN